MGVANLMFLLAVEEGDYERIMDFFRTGMLAMAVIALLVARRVTPFFASRAVAGLDIPKHLESGHWQLAAGMAAIVFSLLQWPVASTLKAFLLPYARHFRALE